VPLIESQYKSPWWLPGGHAQTLFPRLVRRVPPVSYQRERISTPDNDFLDLDWARCGRTRLAILLHGLEGCSRSHYILGLVHALTAAGWDSLAMNFRSCGGEMNRQPRFYHSGETTDLHTVIQHATKQSGVEEIALVGISLGGNAAMKYLGEQGSLLHPCVREAVAISIPCDLASSSRKLAAVSNRVYMKYFLSTLTKKARAKADRFPGLFETAGLESMSTFGEFDDQVTAPLHGFSSAEDYWQKSSSRPFIPTITIPTLMLAARNDPFLTPSCFPEMEARESDLFHLEAPATGGHVGFAPHESTARYWSEQRTVEFLNRSFD
jgi:predicted alpha/beta-fold hydrolase